MQTTKVLDNGKPSFEQCDPKDYLGGYATHFLINHVYMAYQCYSIITGKYIAKRRLMREPGVASLSALILDANKIYRLNLKKAGISVAFEGGKCPVWRWV